VNKILSLSTYLLTYQDAITCFGNWFRTAGERHGSLPLVRAVQCCPVLWFVTTERRRRQRHSIDRWQQQQQQPPQPPAASISAGHGQRPTGGRDGPFAIEANDLAIK